MDILSQRNFEISPGEIADGTLAELVALGLFALVACMSQTATSRHVVENCTNLSIPAMSLKYGMHYYNSQIKKYGIQTSAREALSQLPVIAILVDEDQYPRFYPHLSEQTEGLKNVSYPSVGFATTMIESKYRLAN